MPSEWLEEEFQSSPPSSPPYSPKYSPRQSQEPQAGTNEADYIPELQTQEYDPRRPEITTPPNFQYFSPAASTAFRAAEDDRYAAQTRDQSKQGNPTVQRSEISTELAQASLSPTRIGLEIISDSKSDLDSLFGDSNNPSDFIDDLEQSNDAQLVTDQVHERGLLADPSARGINRAAESALSRRDEELKRQSYEGAFADSSQLPTWQAGLRSCVRSEPGKETSDVQTGVREEEQIARFQLSAYRKALYSIEPSLPKDQQLYVHREVTDALSTSEVETWNTETAQEGIHHCGCGCKPESCTCHPVKCFCTGCDHSEQIDRIMRYYWHNNLEVSSCGCGGDNNKCSCLPGLCHCANCNDHSQSKSPAPQNKAVRFNSSCSLWPPPPPSPWYWRDVFPGGEKILTNDGNWKIKSAFSPIPWKVVKQFEEEVVPKRPAMTRAERDTAISQFYRPGQTQGFHQAQGDKFSNTREVGSHVPEQKNPPGCSCSVEGRCACSPSSCGCGNKSPRVSHRDTHDKLHDGPEDGVTCLCTSGERCGYSPGPRKCSPESRKALQSQCDEAVAQTEVAESPRGYLTVSELAGVETLQDKSPTPTPTPNLQSQMPISRPDTPRPPPDTIPSTPYASKLKYEYLGWSPEPGGMRQSVEPEGPLANWQRESTPAYEDRSSTPSPISCEGDIEMSDAGTGRASVPPYFPPVMSGALPTSRPVSPARPPLPPIPASLNSLRVLKRDERRKSGVRGSKVDKRCVTSSPTKGNARSKSRSVARKLTVSRQPHASVGKLVEQGKKIERNAVEAEISATRIVAKGKVAAAVADIEAQVTKHQEEKDLKQKDGTPVRRSQRRNKGVRTSLN